MNGDALNEPNETVAVTISSATNASISTATGTGTITDDDSQPTVSMAASTASVGESDGTKDLTVSLSAASGRDVTVPYTVSSASGDTATASDDYTEESSGSLTITAGDASGTITVTIASDTIDEADETFTVTLGTPTNAALGTTAKTVVTITDDDSEPTLSISSPSVTEGASGSSATLTFKVTLSSASGKQVTVNYADAGTGTATSGTDYAAITAGTLTFAAGDTSKDVAVTVNGDALNEPNETVKMTISSANNASISTTTGTGTITDDDSQPASSETDLTPVFSSNTFADQVLRKNLRVDVTLPDATGGNGDLSYDLEPELPAGLNFDGTTLAISGVPTEVQVPTAYTLTATDEDGDSDALTFNLTVEEVVNISVSDADPVAEGASGETSLAEFKVSLSESSSLEVTVNYATQDFTAEAATDYVASNGVLTFSPGETDKTVSVTVNGDDEAEANEIFTLFLSNPSNARIDPRKTAQALILNDDEAVIGAGMCGNTFPVGDTIVRIVCSPDPGIDLMIVLPARLARNGNPIEEITVTLATSDQKIHAEQFGFTGDSDHHSLVDIDVSPIPDGGVNIGIPVTSRLREYAGRQRLFMIRHSDGMWEELESSSKDHRIHADVNGFSPFAVVHEVDFVKRRIGNVSRAILPELARAMTASVLEAVGNRVRNAMQGTPKQVNAFSGETEIRRFRKLHVIEEEPVAQDSLSWRETLGDSSFDFSLAGGYDAPSRETHPLVPDSSDRGPGVIGVWIAGDYRRLSGNPDSPIDWSGGLFSGLIGMDMRLERKLLAGVATSWSQGSFDYSAADGEGGEYETRMNGLHPYMALSLYESLSVWTVAGFGFGKIRVEDGQASRQSADGGFRSGALGANLRLFSGASPPGGGATTVDLKAEISLTRMEVEDNRDRIEGLEVRTNRLRFVIRGAHAFYLDSGASVEPFAELGMRRDGGDGETGVGVEIGGGVSYYSTVPGFVLEARGRALRTHEGGLREWGVDGAARFDAGADGRGLSLSLLPSWGESPSGMERLWEEGTAASSVPDGFFPSLRLETEIGYGFPALDERGLFTPYGALGRNGGDVGYRAGSRFNLGSSFDIALEGQRQEFQEGKPEHGITLTGRVNW